MNRSHRVLVVALATLIALPPARSPAAGQPPIVAVFDIDNQGTRLARRLLDRLTSYLATRLAASGRYKVVPRDQLKLRLAGQKKSSYRACYAQSCQIEIGKELAASKSLAPQLLRIGSRCVLTLTLYDLRSAATERAATAKGSCSEDEVIGLIDGAVAELVDQASAEPTPAAGAALAAERPIIGSGALPAAAIQAVIRRNTRQVTACYERALGKSPRLAGRVVSRFTIGATGEAAHDEHDERLRLRWTGSA